MRNGDFSQLLGSNPFFSTPQIIRDPLTGQPFPATSSRTNRLSPNGIAHHEPVSGSPTPDFQHGSNNSIFNSDNPQDQRKDNIRFDYRLNNDNQLTYRYSKYNWIAIDAFRGTFPFARTDWERPNYDAEPQLGHGPSATTSSTSSATRIRLTRSSSTSSPSSGLYQRSRTGINYPYIFPDQGKEIDDKIPTINIDAFTTIRRWTVSLIVAGPDPRVFERDDLREGPAHVQGRHLDRVLRARTTSTRSTSIRSRAARTTRTASSISATARPDVPASVSRTWRWACLPTTLRSASARSPSGARWRPTSSSRTRGSRRRA